MRYLILLSLIASTACSHLKPKPEPGCLKTPPPDMEQVQAAHCHPDYAVCLDHDNTAALIRNVDKLTGYVAQAWALCGESQQAPVNPGPQKAQ